MWYRIKRFLRFVGVGALFALLYAIFRKNVELTFIDYSGTTTQTITIYNNNTGTTTAPRLNEYNGWTARYWTTGESADAEETVANEGKIKNIKCVLSVFFI